MTAEIYSGTRCALGEGPLWHPERGVLYWFDILGKRLFCVEDGEERSWEFDECVSAAGWVDRDTLLIASASGLWRFDTATGEQSFVVAMEADNPLTRSNDGRADPWGGFWIGTMGMDAEPGAGAIYRYHDGALRKLVPDVTIPNAICFAPDSWAAYYTDSADGRLMRQPLNADGWPHGKPQVLLDEHGADFAIDGAVVAADGTIWNAQWNAARVVRYAPDGRLMGTHDLPTAKTTCPAFGGPDLTTLFVTSAAEGLDDAKAGMTFRIETATPGLPEYQVKL